ncbi:MAG: hypothetical protein E7647_08540 [Ruminococcaceae bacterium]|nr:hypothetical protein [Oscillospiraceae bacterium]
MLTYQDYFAPISAQNTFFAGANTADGFFAEYKNLLSEDVFEKIYIIKGGSGTGKSTLMRRAADIAEKKGWHTMYLLCSSDPESLDGVIIENKGRRIAIIDGTAPHTCDPQYPGACGEIVNTGDFWRSQILEAQKEDISLLVKEKKEAYAAAYRYLSAAGDVFSLQQRLCGHCLEREKMESAAERLASSFKNGKGDGRITYRRTLAVSMKGAVRLTSFEEAENLFGVCDCAFISPEFYKSLLQALLLRNFDVTVSLSPIGGIAELYIPGADAAFVPAREGVEYRKVINLRRFANAEKMSEVKQKRIFSSKCLSAVMEGATECLSTARDIHFALENIYRKAMDFKGLDALIKKLSEDISLRLE